MKYVVVGNSAAGQFAAESIRRTDPQGEIIVLTADATLPYSRCLTTYYLAGDIPEERLFIRTPEAVASLRLEMHYATPVTQLDPEARVLLTAAGEAFAYDKCLIAAGAAAVTYDVPGSGLPEVFTLRNLQDAQRIKALLVPGRKAVIIGGGLVSLKSAYALLKQGLQVHMVVSSDHLLSQMLNPAAAAILENHLREHGFEITVGTDVTAIEGEKHVRAVQLGSGAPGTKVAEEAGQDKAGNVRIPADLVIVGKGVRPNTEPFLSSGLAVRWGILVNQRLETNLPGVYAAGDVAETWDRLHHSYRLNAIWPNATLQGRIAGANMAGQNLTYPGSMSMNSVDFFGLRVISAGIIRPPSEAPWQSEDLDTRDVYGRQGYQRLVWQGSVLKGFVLVGDVERAGILTALIKNEQPLSPAARTIIRRGNRLELVPALRTPLPLAP